MNKLIIGVLLIVTQLSVSAQDTRKGDSFIGDWQTKKEKIYAQVYQDKSGAYKVNLTKDLSLKEKPLAILNAEKTDNSVLTISGDGWSGKIKKNELFLEKGTVSYKMVPYFRSSPTMGQKAPKHGIVLFDGSNLDAWTKVTGKDWLVGGAPVDHWKITPDGALEVVPGKTDSYASIITKQNFGDVKLHVEFRILGEVTNGGVYLQSRYELNIKDAYGQVGGSPIGFGNIANPKDMYPPFNVAFPPMQWQTFDVEFRAPRFDATGKIKIENARITVIHNGVTIYNDVELIEVRGSTARLGEAGVGPIYLQDHGVAYQFRNIWVVDKTVKGTENHGTGFTDADKKTTNQTKDEPESIEKVKKGGNRAGGKTGGGKNKNSTLIEESTKTKKGSNNPGTSGDKPVVKKGGSNNKKVDASYEGEMNPAYADVKVNVTAIAGDKPAKTAGFTHPGVMLTNGQLLELRRRVKEGLEPQKSAFEAMKASRFGADDYRPQAYDTVSCGPYSKPNIGCKDEQNDVIAAYTQSLLWFISGEKKYAENAILIMNEWSNTLRGGHNYANGPVQAAWCGSVWPRAAEIIRYTYDGWKEADIARFQNMLRTQYLPSVIHGNCENGNKELAMSEALINIGVFNDDRDVFELGLKMWRGRTPAYIYLKTDGSAPIEPPGCGTAIWGNKGHMPELVDGLLQETARDSHHAWMAFASMVNAAETAYLQGVDLYAEEGKRITAAMEFQAQYLKPNSVPAPEKLEFALNPTWEIAFNHFHNRMGMQLPLMKKVIPTNRPTGAHHHLAWETLTHGDMGSIGLQQTVKK